MSGEECVECCEGCCFMIIVASCRSPWDSANCSEICNCDVIHDEYFRGD